MSSMSGYITYIEYQAGLSKGDIGQGDVFNSPFALGKVDPDYTSSRVVEIYNSAGATQDFIFAWGPALAHTVQVADASGQWVEVNESLLVKDAKGKIIGILKTAFPDNVTRVRYIYDNVIVPQGADKIPTLKAEMKGITLLAKARRIAVYYSQIAAFQAKTDYGFDLGDQLAEKAVGQLSYEIDTEVVNLLDETAGVGATEIPNTGGIKLEWDRSRPAGVSKAEHYEGFAEVLEVGRQIVYDRTKRFAPNYMIIASDVLPVLTFLKGFTAAPAGQINGPYFAGTLNGLKVYVSPAIKAGRFLLGVNGDDMMSSVAVYAPYMAIVPTQLMQYSDGGTSQGWSTMYDLKVLNDKLIVAGEITGSIFSDKSLDVKVTNAADFNGEENNDDDGK